MAQGQPRAKETIQQTLEKRDNLISRITTLLDSVSSFYKIVTKNPGILPPKTFYIPMHISIFPIPIFMFLICGCLVSTEHNQFSFLFVGGIHINCFGIIIKAYISFKHIHQTHPKLPCTTEKRANTFLCYILTRILILNKEIK